jgi:hypothetical protein
MTRKSHVMATHPPLTDQAWQLTLSCLRHSKMETVRRVVSLHHKERDRRVALWRWLHPGRGRVK